MERASIDDVAAKAGVSVATVSRSLRGLPHVAPATRERVQRLARELDYEINPAASRLATGKTHTIGLIAPFLGTWYAGEIVAGAEQVFAKTGYDVLVASVSDSAMEPFLDRARGFGRRVDGAILIDVFAESGDIDRLEQMSVPIVSIGGDLGRFSSVSIDNRAAAATAVRHLTALGHRHIVTVTGAQAGSFGAPVSEMRVAGWIDALAEVGVTPDSSWTLQGGDTVEGGRSAAREFLDRDEPPTAVFCMSDHMAFGILAEARDAGLHVPTDLSVVGFDDHQFSDPFRLTTIRQDVAEMGRAAAEMVADLIVQPVPERGEVVMPVTLVTRGTTGPVPS